MNATGYLKQPNNISQQYSGAAMIDDWDDDSDMNISQMLLNRSTAVS